MTEEERKKRILEEQYFSSKNMTYEEKHNYLSVIKCCKDVLDSINKVDGESKCELVQMALEKQDDGTITANGILALSHENRHLYARITLNNNSIGVVSEITRIAYEGENKVYYVSDNFTLENGKLRRKSYYNYNQKYYNAKVENQKVKGLIKWKLKM